MGTLNVGKQLTFSFSEVFDHILRRVHFRDVYCDGLVDYEIDRTPEEMILQVFTDAR